MSAEFNAELCAVHLGMLLRRVDEMMNELLLHTNKCDLTRDKLPPHLASQARADSDRAKTLIRAWHERRVTDFHHPHLKMPGGDDLTAKDAKHAMM